MNHLLFIALPLGLTSAGVLVFMHRRFRRSLDRDFPLSPFTTQLLQAVTFETPRDVAVKRGWRNTLPIRDVWSLYSNSRRNLTYAHRLLMVDSTCEMDLWLGRAEETHSELTRSLVFSVLEKVMGATLGLPFPLYTQASLGLYVDEQWIVTEMLQRRLEILEARREGEQ